MIWPHGALLLDPAISCAIIELAYEFDHRASRKEGVICAYFST